ncbi:MAG: hypothetical protein KDK02_16830 [Rhodobacteraceae bacterium]|nr:hypothetical protein [Paracoccaceae bacterium]
MTAPPADPLTARAGEKGIVRLFALDMAPEQARFLREPGAAAQALGLASLEPGQVDIFAVSDLDDLGLEGYLTEGAGIAPDRVAADRARLRALEGWVMVVRSPAFGGRAAQIRPQAGVRLIGVYAEPGTDWTSDGAIETASARPGGAGARPAPREARARSRRAGAAVFAVVMLIVAAVVLLVAL